MFMGLFNFSLKIKQGVYGKIAKLPSLRYGLVPDDFFKPIVSTFSYPIFLLRCRRIDSPLKTCIIEWLDPSTHSRSRMYFGDYFLLEFVKTIEKLHTF